MACILFVLVLFVILAAGAGVVVWLFVVASSDGGPSDQKHILCMTMRDEQKIRIAKTSAQYERYASSRRPDPIKDRDWFFRGRVHNVWREGAKGYRIVLEDETEVFREYEPRRTHYYFICVEFYVTDSVAESLDRRDFVWVKGEVSDLQERSGDSDWESTTRTLRVVVQTSEWGSGNSKPRVK